ncbi:hypothetical protein C8J57DRAFT_1261881 [Mycena rebaudengoi]|nr:hypothetical protein C8J57DRAFT_1261881 [Mycena rebaudengoi]
MSLVWAMPSLPAAHLAHIGALGLGAFAEDEAEEHVDTEEEEGSNEGSRRRAEGKSKRHMGKLCARTVDRDLIVMLPIYYPFFNPFNLIPILVADVVITRRSRFLCMRNIKKMEDYSKTSLKNMTNHACILIGPFSTSADVELPNFQYDFNMSDKVGAIWIHMDASWWKAAIQAAKKSWLPAREIMGPVFLKCGRQLGGPAGGSVPELWRCNEWLVTLSLHRRVQTVKI